MLASPWEKRWQFCALVSDEVMVTAAVAHMGYVGYGFATAARRSDGRVGRSRILTPFAVGVVVAEEPDRGLTRLSLPGNYIAYDANTRWLEVRTGEFQAAITFGDAPGWDATWDIGGHPHRTRKRMGHPASGRLWLGDGGKAISGLGLYDWSRGFPARETAWRWAAAAGWWGGLPIGFNLRTGFNDPSEAENAIWLEGKVKALGRAVITPAEDPGGPWRIIADDLDLAFTPDGAHQEALDLALIASRYVQPWGVFRGTYRGRPITAHGVVEDHWARW